ncbi:Rad52/Rad22 family DNA repair protein [Flavobacterium coralii]|uniref:Rad52/Rad22 family DNA repair protein n=1 Tax=Flavobacterium coralii TaxID=2838017 RepID=UPI000C36CB1D|nr:hypothetical protein [Flavobacterium sp.]|tara:strand:+ start:1369 stop:2151 length:783 start_codon:yes stop_codon:yes gene_type:complete
MDILSKLKEPLKIQDVDFRVQSITSNGYATILAYKDARVDMNRLDAVCAGNWQKDFKTIEGRLYCGVGIKINDEWLWRWDVGTESFSDKEKGQASDAFKRACFNWGIGRELYNYPHIKVKLNTNEYTVSNNKAKQTYALNLKEWVWSAEIDAEGNVVSLSAKDNTGNLRYSYPSSNRNYAPQPEPQPAAPSQNAPANTEKPWLNKMEKNGKDMTGQWQKLIKRIVTGDITDIKIVKEHFRISKDNETELLTLINKNNGQI